MDFFGILEMLGGLALFLYGMETMSRGLTGFSKGNIRRLLLSATSHRIRAVFFGALVTAVIQSSSSTTVMTVSLVNAGMMNLSQAAGVIMGANVGTTVTGWLFSLAGIKGDTFFARLFSPSSFSPVFASAGIILLLTMKDGRGKKAGMILMGFSVIMTGMETMCSAAEPLINDPSVLKLLSLADHPVRGVALGTALTAILQSSSASVGLLQVLCNTGVFSYSAVIPIVMGQNIGTCVTAMLAGIGASKNAKRAAFIHLYFNLIGTAFFLFLIFFLQFFISPEFLKHEASAAGVAVIHSLYNIFAVIVLYPWADYLKRLAVLTIP